MFTSPTRMLIAVLSLIVLAGSASAGRLAQRSRIELGFGVRNHSDQYTRVGWDEIDLHTSTGSIGSLSLSHWENEDLAYTLRYSIHDVEHESWVDHWGYEAHETTIVHSLMFGIRFYLPQSRPYSTFRPYLSAGAGAFIGTTEYGETNVCDCETYSEVDNITAAGARLGGGIDLLMGRRFMMGFTAGYNFVEDFPYPIGGRQNYSGSEFGISFSYLFGRSGR